MMVEGEMKEVSEAGSHPHSSRSYQNTMPGSGRADGRSWKNRKRTYSHEENDEVTSKISIQKLTIKYAVAASCNADKHSRIENFKAVKAEYIASLEPEVAVEEKKDLINRLIYHAVEKKYAVRFWMKENALTDVKPQKFVTSGAKLISAVEHTDRLYLPGETNQFTTVTLGTKMDEKIIEKHWSKVKTASCCTTIHHLNRWSQTTAWCRSLK